MYDKYIPKDPDRSYDSWMTNDKGRDKMWKMTTPQIPFYQWAVMAMTFDGWMLRNEHFIQMSVDLREFRSVAGCAPDRVCHMNAWADFLATCEAEAVGFYHSSVSECFWFNYDEEKDEEIPYDLNTMDKHTEVYAYLYEFEKERVKELNER